MQGAISGCFLDFAHGLADHGAGAAEVSELCVAPCGELVLGLDGLVRQPAGFGRTRGVLANRLGDERRLGTEETEQGHFVDPGLIGNATRGSATESGLAVDPRGGSEELLSAGHKDAQSRRAG
jgi:hypothetical protein